LGDLPNSVTGFKNAGGGAKWYRHGARIAVMGDHLSWLMDEDDPSMVARRSTGSRFYTLHVELEGIEPPIWRRLQVPMAITLSEPNDNFHGFRKHTK